MPMELHRVPPKEALRKDEAPVHLDSAGRREPVHMRGPVAEAGVHGHRTAGVSDSQSDGGERHPSLALPSQSREARRRLA